MADSLRAAPQQSGVLSLLLKVCVCGFFFFLASEPALFRHSSRQVCMLVHLCACLLLLYGRFLRE